MTAALLFVFHWVEYLGLLAGLGSFVVRRLGRRQLGIAWAEPPMQYAFAAALAGGIGLILVQALVQGADINLWLVARMAAEAGALACCLWGIRFVAVFAVAAAILLPLTGHAAAVQPAGGALLVDAVHILSAGMWAGGIVALSTLRPPDGWRGAEASALLQRFGRVAVIAFAVTALTGLISATEHLNGPGDLWSTTYGVVLALKTAGVLVMLALSVAWRRGLSAARGDALVAVFVVGATALLAVVPPPA